MSIEDTIGYQDSSDSCVVCGKGLGPRQALATMHQGERKLPICCPLCLEAYQKDPKFYLDWNFAPPTKARHLQILTFLGNHCGPRVDCFPKTLKISQGIRASAA